MNWITIGISALSLLGSIYALIQTWIIKRSNERFLCFDKKIIVLSFLEKCYFKPSFLADASFSHEATQAHFISQTFFKPYIIEVLTPIIKEIVGCGEKARAKQQYDYEPVQEKIMQTIRYLLADMKVV